MATTKLITIKCSEYNEVSLAGVKAVTDKFYVKKSPYRIGVFIGYAPLPNGKMTKVYSDDDIVINNVTLPLAKADESYFCETISINVR